MKGYTLPSLYEIEIMSLDQLSEKIVEVVDNISRFTDFDESKQLTAFMACAASRLAEAHLKTKERAQ